MVICDRTRATLILAAGSAAGLLCLLCQPAGAQPAPLRKVSMSSLTAQGFEIKGVTATQSGVLSTLVLQKEKEVFLCESKDLSIEPLSFECWPVK